MHMINIYLTIMIVPDKMSLNRAISTLQIQPIALRGINAANHGNQFFYYD